MVTYIFQFFATQRISGLRNHSKQQPLKLDNLIGCSFLGVFDVAMTFLDTSPPMIGSIDEKLKQLWALGTR